MAVEKSIRVKIQALVEGLNEVRALAGEIRGLSAAGAGGGTVSVSAGKAGEIRAVVAEIQKLGQEIRNLQPGKLTQLITAGGNVGQLLSGLSKYREAVGGLQKAKADVGNVISRVTERANEFGSAIGQRVSGAVEGLSARLPGLTGGLGGAGAGMAGVGAAGAAAATGIGLVLVGVLAFVAALSALAAAIPVVVSALKSLFDRGVDYNSQLEQTRLGIAAVVASLAEVRDAAGVKLEGADALNASFDLAGEQLAKLKVDAIQTTATFGQIAPAFQAAIGPGVRAGLTLDQVRETTVKIVQAAGALGIPMHQVNQEVRAILEGTINEDARLAKVLGISNEMVKSWKEQGKLQEELNKRLAQFGVAGERAANTMEGLKSNLQEAFEVFSGEATDEAFETLKTKMRQLLPQLFDFKNARLDASFKPLSDILDSIFTRAVNIAADVIGKVIAGVKRVSTFLGENRTQVDAILQTAEGILRIIIHYAGQLLGAAGHTNDWRLALDLTLSTLQGIKIVLLAFAPIIDNAATAARILLAALLASQPLLVGLAAFGKLSGAGAAGGGEVAGSDIIQLNPDGSLKRPTLSALPGGGGKKGGGGRKGGGQDKTRDLTRAVDEANISLRLARLQAQAGAVSDEIESSLRAIQNGLDDALISITDAHRLEATLADQALQNELTRIAAERRAARERRDLAVKNLDTDLTPEQKRLAITAEDKKLTEQIVKLDSERAKLINETADTKAEIVRREAQSSEELQRQTEEIRRQLAILQGGTADAAKGEIRERFRELRQSLVTNFGEASEAVKQLDEYIQLLIRHAQFDELETKLRRVLTQLDIAEARIDAAQQLEGFSDEEADRRKIAAARELRGVLEGQLGELEAIARLTKDPELLQAVERLKIEISLIGVQVDKVGRQINEDIKEGLKGALAGIIRDVGSWSERLLGLVNQILDRIAALLADRLVESVFGPGGILGGVLGGQGQQGSAGGVGGILSGILGFPRSGGGNAPQGSTNGSPAEGPLNDIPGVIKNFDQDTRAGLQGAKDATIGVRDVTEGGFNKVAGDFGEVIGILGNIAAGSKASKVAGFIQLGLKVAGALFGGGGGAAPETNASGAYHKAVRGGRLVRLAEAGFDEVVLTSDPSYRERTAGLLSAFINRTGIVPDINLGTFSDRVLASVYDGIPQMAAGGFASDLAPTDFASGDTYHIGSISVPLTVHATGPQTKESLAAIRRNAARGVQEGIDRARKRRGA